MENKGVIRELTRAERGLTTPGYVRDDLRWTGEVAQRYFSVASAALREYAPNHLIWGAADSAASQRRSAASAWLSEWVFPAVDVAWVHTRDIKSAPPGPLFAGNFCWAGEQIPGPPPRSRTRGVTSVERMLRQGRSSLRATIAHASVVGYAWDAWCDQPGEQPPFGRGLVHLNDAEAREHTELLADLNGRIGTLRPFAATVAS